MIPKQTFLIHIGNDLSISKVDYQKQDIPEPYFCRRLGTYLFLIMDENCNFLFIQYRDPYPNEPIIKPPSIAQIGSGHVKFILPYSKLRSFLLKEPITERDFRLYSKENKKNEIDISSLGDNRLLLRLHEKGPVFIIYFDHRFDTETPIKLDSMEDARNFDAFGQSKITFDQSNQVVLLCLSTKQSQILNFTRPRDLRTQFYIPNKGVFIGRYDNLIEVLDTHSNTVLETLIFPEKELISLEAENTFDGNKFGAIYKVQEEGEIKLFLKVWKVADDLSIQSFQEFQLNTTDRYIKLEFIGKDQIALIDKFKKLMILRIDEERTPEINLVSEIELPKKNKGEIHQKFYLVLFLDDQHFTVWLEATIQDYTEIKFLLFKHEQQTSKSKYVLNTEQSGTLIGKTFHSEDPLHIEMKTIHEIQQDPIGGITHWEDKYILFMTMSQRLWTYDLQTGVLGQAFSLQGTLSYNFTLRKIACINKDQFLLAFQEGEEKEFRILIFDLLVKKTLFDSQNDLEDDINSLATLEVRFGKIIFCQESESEMTIVELDVLEKKTKRIAVFNSVNRLQLSDKEILLAEVTVGGTQEVWVISMKESSENVLYKFELDKILQVLKEDGDFKDWIGVSNEIIAFSFSGIRKKREKISAESDKEEELISLIVFWDFEKQIIVEKFELRLDIESFISCNNNLLFYTYEYDYLGVVSFGKDFKAKENQGKKEGREFSNQKEKNLLTVERKDFESLDDRRIIASLSKKDVFPNSLLLLRKRSIKLEWLNVAHKCMKDTYQKYVILDVMAMIFGSSKFNSNQKSET